jgi:hypothetical protein
MIIDYQLKCLLKNYLETVIVGFGQADGLGFKQKFGRFRNFLFTAQQPKWQKTYSKMWPIEQLYIELG